jgi:MFS family permease
MVAFDALRVDGGPPGDGSTSDKRRKAVRCAVFGSSLEFFDFACYANFAAVISRQFFQTTDHSTALMASFAVFGTGLLLRPIGAIFFGWLGDLFGAAGSVVLSYLMFVVFLNSASVWLMLIGILVCNALIGKVASRCTIAMAEIFFARLRTTGVSIGYGRPVLIFGGFASVICETLIKLSGSGFFAELLRHHVGRSFPMRCVDLEGNGALTAHFLKWRSNHEQCVE